MVVVVMVVVVVLYLRPSTFVLLALHIKSPVHNVNYKNTYTDDNCAEKHQGPRVTIQLNSFVQLFLMTVYRTNCFHQPCRTIVCFHNIKK